MSCSLTCLWLKSTLYLEQIYLLGPISLERSWIPCSSHVAYPLVHVENDTFLEGSGCSLDQPELQPSGIAYLHLTCWILTTEGLLPGIIHFFSNSFIEVKMIYKELHIFNIYNLMSLKVSKHPWNLHQNLSHKQIYHLQKFPLILFTIFFCDKSCNIWKD